MLTALMVVALATMLATRLLVAQDGFVTQTQIERDILQARKLAQGGVDWARAVLLEDMQTSSADHLGEPWAREVPMVEAEGGRIGGRLRDAQARFNINGLIDDSGRAIDRDMLLAYTRLLAALNVDPALGPRLAERMLQTNRRLMEDGSPTTPGVRPAYFTLDDLAQVRGYGPDVLDRLRPYLVALPAATGVNVNTADAVVLAAVADLAPAEAARVIDTRQRNWFRDSTDFAVRANLRIPAGRLFATQSNYFEARVTAGYGGVRVTTSALLRRQPERGQVDVAAVRYGGDD